MAEITHMVRVTPVEDPHNEIICERFESQSDAVRFEESLTEGDDCLLAALPFKAVTLILSELHRGVWVDVRRRLVVI
jgi:hypothetical protein